MTSNSDDDLNKERRRFVRTPFEKSMECQYCFDAQLSDVYLVRSQNISQAGLLIESSFAIPLGATIFFQVERNTLFDKIETHKLQSYIEIELNPEKAFVKLCGKVVRVEPKNPETFYIAVHLINK